MALAARRRHNSPARGLRYVAQASSPASSARRSEQGPRHGEPVMDEPTESLLLRRISSGLAKTFNGFFCKQLVAQLQVVALTDLPGRKKAGNFGGEHPLHQDFDR